MIAMEKWVDTVIGDKDYEAMTEFMLLQLALDNNKKAWAEYLRRNRTNKIDTVTPTFSIEDDED